MTQSKVTTIELVNLGNMGMKNGGNNYRLIIGNLKSGILLTHSIVEPFQDIKNTYDDLGLKEALEKCEYYGIELYED